MKAQVLTGDPQKQSELMHSRYLGSGLGQMPPLDAEQQCSTHLGGTGGLVCCFFKSYFAL